MNNDTAAHAPAYTQEEVLSMTRLNPAPKRRYDITMKIENAPGPFGYVKGYAQYIAPDCIYLLDRFAGVHAKPERTLDIDFRKVDDTTYVGSIYLDAILDEDYFHSGVCKWKFIDVRADLMSTGHQSETTFLPRLDDTEVLQKKSVKFYFLSGSYPSEGGERGFSSSGRRDPNEYRPELRDRTFAISLMPKEASP